MLRPASFILTAFFLAAASLAARSPNASAQAESAGGIALAAIDGVGSLQKFERPVKAGHPPALHYYQFLLNDNASKPARVSLIWQQTDQTGAKTIRLQTKIARRTSPTSRSTVESRALVGVNGGYFNLSDGESASYVSCNGTQVADPTVNKALTGNSRLQSFLPQIFDRSELRILKNEKTQKYQYQISNHKGALPEHCRLVDSLQGGPRLLPDLTAEKEAFVRTTNGEVVDSIGCNRTAARTALGITSGGDLLIVSVAGPRQDEFSSGMTLAGVAGLLKRLHAVEAINFDGGTSTTMVVRDLFSPEKLNAADQKIVDGNYTMVVGRSPETMVKSTLLLVEE